MDTKVSSKRALAWKIIRQNTEDKNTVRLWNGEFVQGRIDYNKLQPNIVLRWWNLWKIFGHIKYMMKTKYSFRVQYGKEGIVKIWSQWDTRPPI